MQSCGGDSRHLLGCSTAHYLARCFDLLVNGDAVMDGGMDPKWRITKCARCQVVRLSASAAAAGIDSIPVTPFYVSASLKTTAQRSASASALSTPTTDSALPPFLRWREKGVVTAAPEATSSRRRQARHSRVRLDPARSTRTSPLDHLTRLPFTASPSLKHASKPRREAPLTQASTQSAQPERTRRDGPLQQPPAAHRRRRRAARLRDGRAARRAARALARAGRSQQQQQPARRRWAVVARGAAQGHACVFLCRKSRGALAGSARARGHGPGCAEWQGGTAADGSKWPRGEREGG